MRAPLFSVLLVAGCVLTPTPLPPLRTPDMPAGARELVASHVSERWRVRASEWPDASQPLALTVRIRDQDGIAAPGVTVIVSPVGSGEDAQITDDQGVLHGSYSQGHYTLTIYYADSDATLPVDVPGHVDIILDLSKAALGEI